MTIEYFTYEPLDSRTIEDPYVAYRTLREERPVYWHDGMKSWVVTRYSDCREVLRNHTVFARDPRRSGQDFPDESDNIQTQDPPHQAHLRQIMMRTLHNQDLAGICRHARQRMERRLESLADTGTFDLMAEIAGTTAMEIINQVVGIDDYTADDYAPLFRGLTRAMDSGLDPSRLEAGITAGIEVKDTVNRWLDASDIDGMLAELSADQAVRSMARPYVRNTLAGVYNAGFSTLFATVGSVTTTLLEHPEALRRLRDESLHKTAAHELLRYTSPAQATSRTAVLPTTLSGTEIRPGETVVTLLAAANRDPRAFDRPDELVLDRWPNSHLAFAWGPHVCLGSALALTWVEEFLRFMTESACRLQLSGVPVYMDSATLRNLISLPVRVSTR